MTAPDPIADPRTARARLRSQAPPAVEDLVTLAAAAEGTADRALVSRRLADLPDPAEGLTAVGVSLIRSGTVEPLLPHLDVACVRRRLRPRVRLGGYGSVDQELIQGPDGAETGEILVVFARLDDVFPALGRDFAAHFPDGVEGAVEAAVDRVTDWLERARRRSDGPVIVANFERSHPTVLGLVDAGHPGGQAHAVASLNRRLAEAARALPGIHVWDVAGCQAAVGTTEWYDPRMDAVARYPFGGSATAALADSLARVLRAVVERPRKCLVVDLDNTLWGGVLGEEGSEGIALGPGYPGSAYRDFQRSILGLHRRGILLAVASKNDHEAAVDVLANHPHMMLRPEHFAALQIHWNEKAESLVAIADELDIGVDALVFVDDNPVECARVRQVLPEVATVQVPDDPLLLAGVVPSLEWFDALTVSQEDLRRPDMYRAQSLRKRLRGAAESLEEFYHSLEMTVEVGRAGPATYGRLAQMTQRTNQFNMTTVRMSEAEIQRLAESDAHDVFWARVTDVYGDNGVVALAIVDRSDETWSLVNLLMSCRVIQRTVETALLTHVVREAADTGARTIRGTFRPTPKNAPARDFYERHGFRRVTEDPDGASTWEADVAALPTAYPAWFEVTTQDPDTGSVHPSERSPSQEHDRTHG